MLPFLFQFQKLLFSSFGARSSQKKYLTGRHRQQSDGRCGGQRQHTWHHRPGPPRAVRRCAPLQACSCVYAKRATSTRTDTEIEAHQATTNKAGAHRGQPQQLGCAAKRAKGLRTHTLRCVYHAPRAEAWRGTRVLNCLHGTASHTQRLNEVLRSKNEKLQQNSGSLVELDVVANAVSEVVKATFKSMAGYKDKCGSLDEYCKRALGAMDTVRPRGKRGRPRSTKKDTRKKSKQVATSSSRRESLVISSGDDDDRT